MYFKITIIRENFIFANTVSQIWSFVNSALSQNICI